MERPEHIVILGFARQGQALARFFSLLGKRVTVSDMRSQESLTSSIDDLALKNVNYVLGGHPLTLLDDCDLLCLSGGVPLDIPVVVEAQKRAIPLSNDAQEFLVRCPAQVIGITGSAGKTTTTTLVNELLKEAGYTTWIGGNIGTPLLTSLPDIQQEHRVVMELSSFQLELMSCSPHIAAVLNITPNHLDRHKTMEAYISAKKHIVAYQNSEDYVVLSQDEPNSMSLVSIAKAQVFTFSGKSVVSSGSYLDGDTLIFRRDNESNKVCKLSDIQLRGQHNILNVLAAISIAHLAGAPLAGMEPVIKRFTGVAHRLEEVRIIKDVLWINDSIATAPERVLAALRAFNQPVVLLAGGRDKDLPWCELAMQILTSVRVMVVFGEAAQLIDAAVKKERDRISRAETKILLQNVIVVKTLDEAVTKAYQVAHPGEVVLLSPGGTSFDAYRDFEERGEHFRKLVCGL